MNFNYIKLVAVTLLNFYLKCLTKKINKFACLVIRYTKLKITLFTFSIIGLDQEKRTQISS